MNESNLISRFQSGFRPGYSTLAALIQLCDDWFNKMDNGELCAYEHITNGICAL